MRPGTGESELFKTLFRFHRDESPVAGRGKVGHAPSKPAGLARGRPLL